jgi:methyl-accepting chemotaxis protein
MKLPFTFLTRKKIKSLLEAQNNYQRLIEQNRQAIGFIKHIEEGNLNAHLDLEPDSIPEQENSLVSALLTMQEQIQRLFQQEQERKWTSEGLTRFTDLIRTTDDKQSLYDSILSQLIKYLGANQGSLFVVSADSTMAGPGQSHLQAVATYAYERKKHQTLTVPAGQGLVGQCFLEGESMFLTDIPETYLRIRSGLGLALPRALLIVPLKLNEQVWGVVELASFQAFKPYQIQFVEKLGESIASLIADTQANEQTRHLLEKLQQQTEELRATEEELRQNMEEMATIQEDITRQSLMLQGLSAAVNATLATVEFTTQAEILTANANFLALMGYSLAELKGKHHRLFLTPDYAGSEDYAHFWRELQQGKAQIGQVSRLTKSGQTVWLSASYTPVFDQSGQLVKIIKFAQDISEQKQKSMDFENQLLAIHASFAVIEFTPEGKIITANANFLRISGYSLSQIRGAHHRIFLSGQQAQSAEYTQFWQLLGSGEFVSGEFSRIDKQGRTFRIKGSYSPIRNMNGQVYKIVKYAQLLG